MAKYLDSQLLVTESMTTLTSQTLQRSWPKCQKLPISRTQSYIALRLDPAPMQKKEKSCLKSFCSNVIMLKWLLIQGYAAQCNIVQLVCCTISIHFGHFQMTNNVRLSVTHVTNARLRVNRPQLCGKQEKAVELYVLVEQFSLHTFYLDSKGSSLIIVQYRSAKQFMMWEGRRSLGICRQSCPADRSWRRRWSCSTWTLPARCPTPCCPSTPPWLWWNRMQWYNIRWQHRFNPETEPTFIRGDEVVRNQLPLRVKS